MKKSLLALLLCSLSFPAFAVETTTPSDIKDDPYLLLDLFGSAFALARTEYVDETKDRELIEAAINGMLSALDPHSSFLNKEDFNDIQIQTSGKFGGLGIEVTSENGLVRVISPIDGTPAFNAGIQAGDMITHIDDEAVIGMTLNDAVKKMRGEPDTKIKLTILRGTQEPFDVDLTRDIIKIESVRHEIKDDVGYLRIITFSDTTTKNAKKAVQEMKEKLGDKLKGIVIDLRNNPGGLLDQAEGIADLFLNQGEIVSTRSRDTEQQMRLFAKEGDIANGLPLVVLINEGSASASEIVAGALQDHHRAVIVGTPSFGKGSVQSVRPIIGYGALKITTARYYTPSGRSIQAEGIKPDIVIPRAEIKEIPIIEGYKENNLHNALGQKDGQKKEDIKKTKDADKKDEKNEDKKDYQLDRAIDILRSIAFDRMQKSEM